MPLTLLSFQHSRIVSTLLAPVKLPFHMLHKLNVFQVCVLPIATNYEGTITAYPRARLN